MSCLSSAIRLSTTSIAMSLLLLSGCNSTKPSGTNQNSSLSALNEQLNEIVSNNSCTASFQCKVLEVGARACGGPSKYVVYSTLKNSQEQAENIAQNITQQERQINDSPSASDCSPVLKVHSLCIDAQCRTINVK